MKGLPEKSEVQIPTDGWVSRTQEMMHPRSPNPGRTHLLLDGRELIASVCTVLNQDQVKVQSKQELSSTLTD